VVEDPNGKTFTVSSRVEFRVTKEDNEAEVTCTVDHESLQNSERSTTQKLQVHCTWRMENDRIGSHGEGCRAVERWKRSPRFSKHHTRGFPLTLMYSHQVCRLTSLPAQRSCHKQGPRAVTLPLHMHTCSFPCLSLSPVSCLSLSP